jgi:hypothetical protein
MNFAPTEKEVRQGETTCSSTIKRIQNCYRLYTNTKYEQW